MNRALTHRPTWLLERDGADGERFDSRHFGPCGPWPLLPGGAVFRPRGSRASAPSDPYNRAMKTTSILATLALVASLSACASAPDHQAAAATAPVPAVAQISHDVFFTFQEGQEGQVDGLIAACERLRDLPGVVHLTAGRRDPAQQRSVNEQSYHVALHVEFTDQAAYDAYGPHPTHQALVQEFLSKTSHVVVYDALLGR